jgi:hypothetical protein
MAGYLTIAEADALIDGWPEQSKWLDLSESQKAIALEVGADYIDRFQWKGAPYTLPPYQFRMWPRNISDERVYISNGIPDQIKYASMLFGLCEFEDSNVEYGGTSMFEMQGMYSTNYMPGKEMRTPGQILKLRALKAVAKYRASQNISRA